MIDAMDSVSRIVCCTLLATTFACSSGSKPIHPYYRDLFGLLTRVPTVVVADLLQDDTPGEVAIRPTDILKGSLPVGTDGVYRFKWPRPHIQTSGVWLFGPDGTPFADAESRRSHDIPDYPWTLRGYELTIYASFPIPVDAEARRVLNEADLVVTMPSHPTHRTFIAGSDTFVVDQVLRPSGDVAVGDTLTFTYDNLDSQRILVNDLDPQVFALQRAAHGWRAVPTWLLTGWGCDEVPTGPVYGLFPQVYLHTTGTECRHDPATATT